MIHSQSEAEVVLAPVSLATGATAQMHFDRAGYDYAEVDVLFGALATNGGVPSVLKIAESDATVVSNFADVGGATYTPLAATLGGSMVKFQLDLRKRKRYIMLNITNGTTTLVVGAVARLSRGKQSADSATQQSVQNRDSTSVTSVATIVSV